MIGLLAVLAVLAVVLAAPVLVDVVWILRDGDPPDDELDDFDDDAEYQPPPAWSADQVRAYAEPLRARLDAALAADTGADPDGLNPFTDFYDWNNQPATWGEWLP